MKNQNVFIIIISIIVIIIVALTTNFLLRINSANKIYGSDKCVGHDSREGIGLTVMTSYKCKVCGFNNESGSSMTPSMCPLCQKLTSRCPTCGKLIENTGA